MLCGWAAETLATTVQAYPQTPTATPTLAAIQELSHLTVLEVPVTDVVEHSIAGSTGGVNAVVKIHGSALIAADLASAEVVEADHDARRLVLRLPSPTVLSARLDAAATHIAGTHRTGLWQFTMGHANEDTAVAAALVEGEARIQAAASHPDLVRRAKRQTERVLANVLGRDGWTVTVVWSPP
jgi:hypothetical protein